MTRRATLPPGTTLFATPDLSPAMEDYLKAIYLIDQQCVAVTTQVLAGYLAVAPPSVTEMVKRLVERDLVAHTPYRPMTLTPTGEGIASELVKRHSLIVAFLVAALGYAEDHESRDADDMEHALSSQSLARIAERLRARPCSDPSGLSNDAPTPRDRMLTQHNQMGSSR